MSFPRLCQQETSLASLQAGENGAEAKKDLVGIRISTQHAVTYGEFIRIVGSGRALGDWNPQQGPG